MPLTLLLHNNTLFAWVAACQEAFDGLKTAFTTGPAWLSLICRRAVQSLIWYATLLALALVLCSFKKVGPLLSWSRKMVPAEQNNSIAEQELFAVMEALKAFCCYIDGIPFNLSTGHKPNTFLDTQPTLSPDSLE